MGLGSISSMHKFVALTICQSSPRQEQFLLSHHICGKVKQNTYLNPTTLKDPGSSKHECIGIQFPLHTGCIGDAYENNPAKSEIKGQDLFLLTSLSNSALGFHQKCWQPACQMVKHPLVNQPRGPRESAKHIGNSQAKCQVWPEGPADKN